MEYNLDINNRAFKAIKNGTKRVEIRVTKLDDNSFYYGILKSGDVNHYSSIEELLILEGTRYTLSSTNDFDKGVESINSISGYKEAIPINGVYAIHIKCIDKD